MKKEYADHLSCVSDKNTKLFIDINVIIIENRLPNKVLESSS